MLYLKSPEQVIDYLTRDVEATIGRELALSRIASGLADVWLERSLSIQYYLLDFELNRSLVGYIPRRPIISIAPTILSTGLQIRPMRIRPDGSRETIAGWQDVSNNTDPLNSIYNPRTGRLEIFQTNVTDYGRLAIGNFTVADSWQAQIEVYAGYLLDTTLAAPVAHGSTNIQLSSTVGIVVNSTRVNFGDSTTEYLITNLVGSTATITPALAGTLNSGVSVTQVVPENVKLAIGSIISDQLTYEPNTLRQTSTLDVLTDRLSRMDADTIPREAKRLLALYHN